MKKLIFLFILLVAVPVMGFTQKYRVEYESEYTGLKSHGQWQTDSILVQEWIEYENEKYPYLKHTMGKTEIGYWILTYNKGQGYRSTTTTQLVDVYTMAETYFPGNCINFENKLKESIQFEMNESANGCKSFYVEVRKINKRGKFRAMNWKEIKEYLQKWNH